MNPSTERAMKRLLDRVERSGRRRRPSFTAPMIVGLGLVLGYQLLVRLLPRVWSSVLPGGLDQARTFRGLPGMVFSLARACYYQAGASLVVLAVALVVAIVLSRGPWPLRVIGWLAALGVILADALLLVVILRTALQITAQETGLPLPF